MSSVPPVEGVARTSSTKAAVRRPTAGAGRVWPSALLVWVVASALAWLRLPAAARDTYWAEDGQDFTTDWLLRGGPLTLFRPYGGYLQLLPRVVTWAVTEVLPVQWWAAATTAAASIVIGGVAALVFVFSRDVAAAPVARIGLALVVVLAPLAGLELVGNVANSHWYLLFLTPWLLLATPRTRAGMVAMVLLALVVTMSEPLSMLFVPLAAWRWWKAPRCRPVIYGYAVGLAAQVASVLLSHRPRSPGRPPWSSVAEGYWTNASLSIVTGNGQWTGSVLLRWGFGVAFASVLVFVAFGVYGFVRGWVMVRVAVLALLLGSVAIWSAGFILNNDANLYYSGMGPERFADLTLTRYGAVPSMVLASMVPLAAGVLVARRPRLSPLAVGAVAVLTLVMSLNFVHRDNHRSGIPWTEAVAAARVTCAAGGVERVKVPIQPAAWVVTVPCELLS